MITVRMAKIKNVVSLRWAYLGDGRYSCTANTVTDEGTGEGTSSHEAMTRALLLLTAATGLEKAQMDLRFE